MLKWVAVGFLSVLIGCASGTGGPIAGQTVDKKQPVFVAPIADATDTDGDVVSGSGEAANAAMREALRQRGIAVVLQPYFGYTLRVTLTHWEHHATEWNFMPDVVALSAELLDASGQSLVATGTARESGSVIQFVHEMPDRLLPDLADQDLMQLYGD